MHGNCKSYITSEELKLTCHQKVNPLWDKTDIKSQQQSKQRALISAPSPGSESPDSPKTFQTNRHFPAPSEMLVTPSLTKPLILWHSEWGKFCSIPLPTSYTCSFASSHSPNMERSPQANHTTRENPTVPEFFSTPLGEMKMPLPTMLPMRSEKALSKVIFFLRKTASSFFLCFPMAALLTPGEGHALRRYGAPQPSSRFTCKTRKEWGIWGSSVQDKSFFAAICQDLWSPSLPRDPPSKQTAG